MKRRDLIKKLGLFAGIAATGPLVAGEVFITQRPDKKVSYILPETPWSTKKILGDMSLLNNGCVRMFKKYYITEKELKMNDDRARCYDMFIQPIITDWKYNDCLIVELNPISPEYAKILIEADKGFEGVIYFYNKYIKEG